MDPHLYDKQFCQLMGYRYIQNNVYGVGLIEKMRESIQSMHFGFDFDESSIMCRCTQDGSGRKCCDNNCALRSLQVECQPSCGEMCDNQSLSKGMLADHLRIKSVVGCGLSVASTRSIEQGAAIVEYVGIVQEGQLFKNQLFAYPFHGLLHGLHLFVNAEENGNEARLIQHSLDPNCKIRQWITGRELRLVVSALRDIDKDEVVTICYPQMLEDYLPI